MFECPAGWVERASGPGSIFVQPRDPASCVLYYEERVSPLRSLRSLTREVLARENFKALETGYPVRFWTDEGEHAARVRVRGGQPNREVVHIVAGVFVEDFSTLLHARIFDAGRLGDFEELVTNLVRRDRLLFGVRPRRFLFLPPLGWHHIPRGLEVAFYPSTYPRAPISIVVAPAEPWAQAEEPATALARLDESLGLTLEQGFEATRFKTRRGISGKHWRMRRKDPAGNVLVRHLVVLRDPTYHYAVRLEGIDAPTPVDQYLDVLMTLVHSIERLPERLPEAAGVAQPASPGPNPIWYDD